MQYLIRNLEDREIGRANDARSAWALIDAQWPDAAACILGGPWFRGWMQLSVQLPAGEALIIRNGKTVGGGMVEEWEMPT
jgi:hypothetical protein